MFQNLIIIHFTVLAKPYKLYLPYMTV